MIKKKSGNKLGWMVGYFLYLFIVWTLIRYSVKLSDLVEELWLKPVLWLSPLVWLRIRKKLEINMFQGNSLKAVVVGLLMVLIYMIVNGGIFLLRGGGLNNLFGVDLLNNLGLGFATAVTEEIVFSGVIFASLYKTLKKPVLALVLSTLMFGAIHIPIGVFVYDYNFLQMVYFLTTVMVVGAVNQYLFYVTGNVSTSILSHWGWVVATSIFR